MKDYSRQPYVYFARVGKYVKVGYSRDVATRLKSIKSARLTRPDDLDESAPVVLLHTNPGGSLAEQDTHVALVDFHVVGEWFVAEQELIDGLRRFVDGRTPYVPRSSGPFRADLARLADSA